MGVIRKKNPETGKWEIYGSTEARDINLIDVNDNFVEKNVEGALREMSDKIAESIAGINAQKDALIEHSNTLAKHNNLLHEHTSAIEWLKENGGGGGGGTGTAVPTITSSFETNAIVSKDEEVIIPIFYSSPNLGEGTAYVMIDNVEVAIISGIKQGNNNINIGKMQNLRNEVSIYVKDRANLLSNQLSWTIIAGGIDIEITFDDTADYYVTDMIYMQFDVQSASTEPIIMHMTIDYDEYEIECDNGFNEYLFPELSVGIHKITMYVTSGPYSTEIFEYNIVIVSSNSLYISSMFKNGSEFILGTPVAIPYRISKASDEKFEVRQYLNGKLQKTLLCAVGSYYWTLSNLDIGTYSARIEVIGNYDEPQSLEFRFEITPSGYVPVKITESGLQYRLSAQGRTNQDIDRDHPEDKSGNGIVTTLHNFNWFTNGWIDGELVCDSNAYVEIDFKPWETNAIYGSTIEIQFTGLDIGLTDSRIFDYTDTETPFKGAYIDTEQSALKSLANTGLISIDKDVETTVSFVIDRRNKFGKIFINGICSRAFFLSDTGSGVAAKREDFTHSQKIYLNSKKGESNFGACRIKDVRVYGRVLSDDEIVTNYIAQELNLAKQEQMYNFNFNNTTLPVIRMYGDMSNMTLETPVPMRIRYTSPNEDLYGQSFDLPYCQVNWQGTSSLQYVLKNFTVRLKDENLATYEYSPYPNGIKEDTYCFKADYMESTHSRNCGIAKFVNSCLYDEKNPAQASDPNIRNSINGFPCVMYINDELQGIYNFNLDRYSTKSYGYTDPEKCLVYEVSANSDTTAGAFYKWTEASGKDKLSYYQSDFECLYPPTRAAGNDNMSELMRLIEWVNDSSDEDFKDNFERYFNKQYVLRYYLFVLVFGAVDSLGKNMKLSTWDGLIWYPQVYDADTTVGLDNTGFLKFDMDIEMGDENVFNTTGSMLWKRIVLLFQNELREEYSLMRRDRFTVDNIMKYMYGEQISQIPATFYNKDMQTKYLNFGSTYLYALHGSGEQHIKKWIRERIIYIDSLLGYMVDFDKDKITLRSSKLGYVYLDIETYIPMYVSVKWRDEANNTGLQTKRVGRGEKVRFEYNMPTATDQEILVYAGHYLKRLGNVSNLEPTVMLIANADRLTEIECHSPNLINTDLSECTLLQRIDLSNSTALGTGIGAQPTLNITGCKYLRYCNCYNTKLTAIYTMQSGGNLEEIYYPESVQVVQLTNQTYLKVVGIPYSNVALCKNLADVMITNCDAIEYIHYPFTEEEKNKLNFDALKYVQNLILKSSLSTLKEIRFNGFSKLTTVEIGAMHNIESLGFDNMLNSYDIPTLNSVKVSDCPLVKKVTMNVTGPEYKVSFAPKTIIDLAGMYSLEAIESNDSVKGLETIIVPLRIKDITFTAEFGDGVTDIKNIWSSDSNHNSDGYQGIDFKNLNINSIDMKGLLKVPNGLYFNLTLNKNNPNMNVYRDGKTYPYFRPEGTIDIANFRGSAVGLLKGVDLNKLNVIIEKNQMQTDLTSYFEGAIIPDADQVNYILSKYPFGDVWDYALCSSQMAFSNTEIVIPTDRYLSLKGFFRESNADKDIVLHNNIVDAQELFMYCENIKEYENNWERNWYEDGFLAYDCYFATGGDLEFVSTDWGGYGFYDNVISVTYVNVPTPNYKVKFITDKNKTSVGYMTWGDGGITKVNVNDEFDHVYEEPGVYVIRGHYTYGNSTYLDASIKNIISRVTHIASDTKNLSNAFNGCKKLSEVTLKDLKPTNMKAMFYDCSALTTINFENLDTSNTTDMSELFSGCSILEVFPTNLFDTSSVKTMRMMFYNCKSLKHVNLKTFNTENVTSFAYMFYGCNILDSIDISNFDTSNASDFSHMFNGCNALTKLNLLNFVMTNAENLNSMFYRCENLTELDLSSFKGSKFKNFNNTFNFCTNLKSIIFPEEFNTSNATDMTGMFQRCEKLESLDISMFDVRNVEKMGSMFASCVLLANLDLSNFVTNKLNAVTYMFSGCESLTALDLSKFNTSKVENATAMFINCSGLESLNISSFDAGKLKTATNMFSGCGSLKSLDLSKFIATSLTNTSGMFNGCKSLLQLDVSTLNMANVIDTNYMFSYCSGLESLDVSGFNTQNVIDMNNMFAGCSGLKSLDVSNFNTKKVNSMYSMFSGCRSLTSLDLSSFDTSNVTDMSDLVSSCNLLESIDISSFNTSNVINMNNMFKYCYKLANIDLSKIDFKSVISANHMFNSVALKTIDLSNKDTGKLMDVNHMFYNLGETESIKLNNCNFEKVTNAKNFIGLAGKLVTFIPPKNIKTSITINASKLSNESINLIIENLATVTTSQVLTLGTELIAKMSEEQMASIIDKNWTVN